MIIKIVMPKINTNLVNFVMLTITEMFCNISNGSFRLFVTVYSLFG